MKKVYILIIIFLVVKLVYYLQSYLSPYPNYNRIKINYFGDYFLQTYSNHDSGFYERIVEKGYPLVTGLKSEEAIVYAFFPTFPFAAKLLMETFHTSGRFALFIIATIFSILMLIVFYYFTKDYLNDENIAYYSSLALILFPHHFYFSMLYTESMFLFFVILAFYSSLKKNCILFIISSCLMVITRVNGILILLPLMFFFNRTEHRDWYRISKYYSLLPMVFTFLLYLIFLKYRTGEYFAFKSAVTIGWGKHIKFPLTTLYDTLADPSKLFFFKYNAIYSLLFLGISVIFIFKKQYSFFLLSLISILLPLYAGDTVSMPRYISVIFPFSILFGTLINKSKIPYLILTIMFVLQLITFTYWNINDPMSY